MGRGRQADEAETAAFEEKGQPTPEPGAGGEQDWPGSRIAVVDKIIGDLEGKFTGADFKGSVSDYIRLIQVRKELGEEFQGKVEVSWVGS